MNFGSAVVRGSGDVGSAVAHALYMRGVNVIVHDDPRPAHLRRGMAFTDALFDGQAVLDGVLARQVTDWESLGGAVAADGPLWICDRPLQALLERCKPNLLVDARMRKRAAVEDQRDFAPTVVGLGPGFDTRSNCHLAIETAWGTDLGAVLRSGATAALSGEPRPLGGAGRERFVYAPQAGSWHTALQIGNRVTEGQVVGQIGTVAIVAPLSGFLRGLSHAGVLVAQRQKIVEVDPRVDASSVGRGERPIAIARGVLRALDLQPDPQSHYFGFEREFEATLDCMPMSVRLKLDLCGLKLGLEDWRALSRASRETVLDARCESAGDEQRLRQFLELTIADSGGVAPARIEVDCRAWQDRAKVPARVSGAVEASGAASLSGLAWGTLNDLQRFALCKIATSGPLRSLRPALTEFGLLRTP